MLDVPRNEEAELFIISEIMLGQDALAKAQDEGLRDEHFFSQKNRALYATIRDMHERGESIDPLSVATVIDDLGKMGSYPMQKGEVFDFLSSMDSYTFGGGIRTHVKSLIEKFNRRKIITAAEQATREASNGEIVNALCIMTELTLDERGRELSIEELGNKFIDDCKRGVVGHLEWWCEEWTNKLGKLSNEIFMISAPRSTGKTALMLQWMNRNHTDGHVTPLASIEMEKAELLPRMIAHRGQVCTYTMKTRGYVTADEESKARKALMEIKDLCYDVREHGMSIEDIRIWALGKKRIGAAGLWIDNLLSINDGGKQYQSKTVMYDSFLREFRDIRDKVSCPVFVLCHPNAEGKIAWSTDVENFADIILHLQSVPEDGLQIGDKFIPYDYNIDGKHVVAIFKKNRQGIQPIASLDFIGSTQTFRHLRWERER